jgi:hypothetical protein
MLLISIVIASATTTIALVASTTATITLVADTSPTYP